MNLLMIILSSNKIFKAKSINRKKIKSNKEFKVFYKKIRIQKLRLRFVKIKFMNIKKETNNKNKNKKNKKIK